MLSNKIQRACGPSLNILLAFLDELIIMMFAFHPPVAQVTIPYYMLCLSACTEICLEAQQALIANIWHLPKKKKTVTKWQKEVRLMLFYPKFGSWSNFKIDWWTKDLWSPTFLNFGFLCDGDRASQLRCPFLKNKVRLLRESDWKK